MRLALPAIFKRKAAEFLGSGISPQKLALTLALGATLGIIPALWGATLLCVGVALLFRLNQAAIQIINYLVYPLQLALLVPYYRLGGVLFSRRAGPSLVPASSSSLPSEFGAATLKAFCAWGLTAPVITLLVYCISLPLLRSSLRKRGAFLSRNQFLPGSDQFPAGKHPLERRI
jgi:uncharacterized protein (DUF2062 family)